MIDVDQLAAAEKENWVWGGVQCLEPAARRCLVSLTRGGGDAHVVREFDVPSRRFVARGFVLPEAKGSLAWIDINRVFVDTDFGPGSMTESGYPRIVKEWRRGTPLASASTVFEGRASDTSASAWKDFTPRHERRIRHSAYPPSSPTNCSCGSRAYWQRSTNRTMPRPTRSATS
ncbi:hypothetical protein LP420_41105 [Massilia sp. B-10]|nr:hypothetical protein LP420_41105 [Massilia sp. B-10]